MVENFFDFKKSPLNFLEAKCALLGHFWTFFLDFRGKIDRGSRIGFLSDLKLGAFCL